jgi:hypothetical protein
MPHKDQEKAREARRRYRAANPDKVRETERRSRENASEEVKERTRERNRRYRAADPERRRELDRIRSQRWRAANPEKARERDRRVEAKRRGQRRGTTSAQTLKRKYGLSPEQWAQLLTEQGGLCYLCGEPVDLENKRNIHVDHDHSCCRGDVSCGLCIRGLACACCNPGIAMFGDDPDRMELVAQRLRAANAEVAARIAAALIQGELPIDFHGALA